MLHGHDPPLDWRDTGVVKSSYI